MPDTIQGLTASDLLYLLQGSLIVAGIAVIAWLINRGFSNNDKRLESIDGKIDGLTYELKTEREQRIQTYGELKAEIAAHKAVCEERHR